MKLQITGRQVKVTEAMKEFVSEKLLTIEKYSIKLRGVHCLMSVQKESHKCEINLDAKNMKLNAQASSKNMYESITKCVDKLDHQIRNHKTSHHDKHNRMSVAEFEKDLGQTETEPETETEGDIALQESA